MQNSRQQPGQSMAPSMEYLNQMQRIYLDTWRRCSEAGIQMTQGALDECHRINQDILNAPLNHYQALGEKFTNYQQDVMHMLSDAQVEFARTLSEGTRATAETTRNLVEQQANQMEQTAREQAGAQREMTGNQHDRQRDMQEDMPNDTQQAGGAQREAAGGQPHGSQAGAQREADRGREQRGKGGQEGASTVHQRLHS